MNVVRSKSSRSASLPRVKVENQPTTVNLYQEIPNFEVSLDDFEEFALDRLKVGHALLRKISCCCIYDDSNITSLFLW
jgi:hypothetical protein